MNVAAVLRLNLDEAGVLDAALRYYTDTLVDPDDRADNPDLVEATERAERIRTRLRKSITGHGYEIELVA
jgi:hypothetical protein